MLEGFMLEGSLQNTRELRKRFQGMFHQVCLLTYLDHVFLMSKIYSYIQIALCFP